MCRDPTCKPTRAPRLRMRVSPGMLSNTVNNKMIAKNHFFVNEPLEFDRGITMLRARSRTSRSPSLAVYLLPPISKLSPSKIPQCSQESLIFDSRPLTTTDISATISHAEYLCQSNLPGWITVKLDAGCKHN